MRTPSAKDRHERQGERVGAHSLTFIVGGAGAGFDSVVFLPFLISFLIEK